MTKSMQNSNQTTKLHKTKERKCCVGKSMYPRDNVHALDCPKRTTTSVEARVEEFRKLLNSVRLRIEQQTIPKESGADRALEVVVSEFTKALSQTKQDTRKEVELEMEKKEIPTSSIQTTSTTGSNLQSTSEYQRGFNDGKKEGMATGFRDGKQREGNRIMQLSGKEY